MSTYFISVQCLKPPTPHLIHTGIATIHDMATRQACVAYENANQHRCESSGGSNTEHRWGGIDFLEAETPRDLEYGLCHS